MVGNQLQNAKSYNNGKVTEFCLDLYKFGLGFGLFLVCQNAPLE